MSHSFFQSSCLLQTQHCAPFYQSGSHNRFVALMIAVLSQTVVPLDPMARITTACEEENPLVFLSAHMLCNPLHLAHKVVGQPFPLDSLYLPKTTTQQRSLYRDDPMLLRSFLIHFSLLRCCGIWPIALIVKPVRLDTKLFLSLLYCPETDIHLFKIVFDICLRLILFHQ